MIRIFLFLLFALTTINSVAQLCVQRLVSPTYPRLARIAQIQGKVTVEFTVESGGKIAVGKTTGPKLLIENTTENLRNWILCPDQTSRRFTITFSYLLQGQRQYHDGPADVVFQLPQSVTITAKPYEPQPSAEQPLPRIRRRDSTDVTGARLTSSRVTRMAIRESFTRWIYGSSA